jgi:hypothetical protein
VVVQAPMQRTRHRGVDELRTISGDRCLQEEGVANGRETPKAGTITRL